MLSPLHWHVWTPCPLPVCRAVLLPGAAFSCDNVTGSTWAVSTGETPNLLSWLIIIHLMISSFQTLMMKYPMWYKDKYDTGHRMCDLWVAGPLSMLGAPEGTVQCLLGRSHWCARVFSPWPLLPPDISHSRLSVGPCGRRKSETLQETEWVSTEWEINYQTKRPEYIWMRNEENMSIFVLWDYLKFKINDVYPYLHHLLCAFPFGKMCVI